MRPAIDPPVHDVNRPVDTNNPPPSSTVYGLNVDRLRVGSLLHDFLADSHSNESLAAGFFS